MQRIAEVSNCKFVRSDAASATAGYGWAMTTKDLFREELQKFDSEKAVK